MIDEIEDELCATCNGSGEGYYENSVCDDCNGYGIENSYKCEYCNPKNRRFIFNKKRMCVDCLENYNDYLEDKADSRRKE